MRIIYLFVHLSTGKKPLLFLFDNKHLFGVENT